VGRPGDVGVLATGDQRQAAWSKNTGAKNAKSHGSWMPAPHGQVNEHFP
jgi:hypothetical protein